MKFFACCVVVAALACAVPASAEVSNVAPNGFQIQESVHIAAPPDKVYASLITPMHWWSSEHSFSGDSGNMTLDATAGGCWCETLPDGGSVQLMVVEFAAPGKLLRLSGALGPFQAHAITGTMTFELKQAGDGTALTLTYEMAGYVRGGFGALPKAADGVLTEQMVRLKKYLETGAPQ